ncbi:hypothetical protein F4861DRAFT_505648 [Xylaria intraflava]|nr:hypothetical protein F4861DRAFT_505648 [Xylaria intraflava]
MSTAPKDLPANKAKCTAPAPVPTHGPGGVFTVARAAAIAAPALTCIEKVLDLPNYAAWNKFIPTATITAPGRAEALTPALRTLASRPGHAAPGAKGRFEAVMAPGSAPRNVDLEVTLLEAFEDAGRTGYRVAWKSVGFPHFLLRSERVQEFVEDVSADGAVVTRYATWETFGGVLAYLVPRAALEDGFDRWTDGLKKIAEQAAAGPGS